jgi:RNA polymerase sigma-70 factor (ECF subfamily)
MASWPEDRADLLAADLSPDRISGQSMSQFSDDTLLVGAARNGDREAFGHLYRRYARIVHGVLLAKVPLSDVDDLVQDVFMTALRHLSKVREAEKFGAWLAAIARNRGNDYHRRSRPEDQLTDDSPYTNVSSSGDSRDDEAAVILETIRSLPDSYRETLILRLVEGMTGPEIAARTGMTHGSVRVNLHRGKQQLREKLSSNRKSSRPEKETL